MTVSAPIRFMPTPPLRNTRWGEGPQVAVGGDSLAGSTQREALHQLGSAAPGGARRQGRRRPLLPCNSKLNRRQAVLACAC